jgi:hypothetical protein
MRIHAFVFNVGMVASVAAVHQSHLRPMEMVSSLSAEKDGEDAADDGTLSHGVRRLAPSGKVDVCHKRDGQGYIKIDISGKALQSHVNHGDDIPGAEVPDSPGYKFDDDCKVIDIDECDLGTDDCAAGSICVNNDGGFDCIDIDECDLGTDDCAAGSICVSNDGGFHCECLFTTSHGGSRLAIIAVDTGIHTDSVSTTAFLVVNELRRRQAESFTFAGVANLRHSPLPASIENTSAGVGKRLSQDKKWCRSKYACNLGRRPESPSQGASREHLPKKESDLEP